MFYVSKTSYMHEYDLKFKNMVKSPGNEPNFRQHKKYERYAKMEYNEQNFSIIISKNIPLLVYCRANSLP